MEWIALDVGWQNVTGDDTQIQAKFKVLTDILKPMLNDLVEDSSIEHWNHTFQGSTNRLDKPEIFILVGVEGDTSDVAQELRSRLNKEGLIAGEDFVIDSDFHPKTMEKYWGRDNLERWGKMKALSSSLAIAAYEGELGEDFHWHRQQNRPGHIWSNQTGCGFLEESYIYQSMAIGYLQHIIDVISDEDAYEQLEEAESSMQQSLSILSGFMR